LEVRRGAVSLQRFGIAVDFVEQKVRGVVVAQGIVAQIARLGA
jgi:hypothetical protein